MELGANLADNNAARSHYFAAKTLNATSLTVAVATVAAAALAFLMCHDRFLILWGKSLEVNKAWREGAKARRNKLSENPLIIKAFFQTILF